MNSDAARVQMVSQQVRTWDVLDPRVLDTMGLIDRQIFVPKAFASVAFADGRIPLAHDQVMLSPKVVGRALQALDISPSDSVLEIGTGSGYVTACLADLGGQVTSMELHDDLSAAADAALQKAGITNVSLSTGDVFEYAPKDRFDVIVVTGSLPDYDERFEKWLAPGGRLFVVSGRAPVMEAFLVTRIDEQTFDRDSLFETDVPALLNAPRKRAFHF
ncbi:MAG: protein-L-isoaspartate O-methyltransferase [Pseudomonadota bacterium]